LEVAPSAPGPIAAIATIATSDQDLPGESFTDLTITITGTAVNPCPADLTGNGIINVEDLNAWIFAYNNGTPACDINGDGLCMPDDFTFWVNQQPLGCP
ncbi:MAG: GC-type dockerin domain-anchored protein, partial [Planctomycetota bacterium]